MAEQVNKDVRPGNTSPRLDSAKLNELFHQISHDIRVPVTGLKMLWPMLDEVTETEREEVAQYLKSLSYELFDLIENLTLLLIDFELLNDEPEMLSTDEILSSITKESGFLTLSEVSTEETMLRRQHFLRCIEVALDICGQITDERAPASIVPETRFSADSYTISFSGPALGDPDDQYGAEIHYSLFNRAKGNSRIAGFSLLRLRNLMNMIRGKLKVDAAAEATKLVMQFPRD